VGDISEHERQRVRVEGDVGRAELLILRTTTAEARERLSRLVGTPLAGDVQLERAPEPLPWATFAGLRASEAASDRPDVVAAREAVRRSDALVLVERRERLPRPTLSVGLENERSRFGGDDFKGVPFGPEGVSLADTDRFLVLEVSLAIPLLDRNRGAIASALAEAHAARAEAELAAREATSELRLLQARGAALSDAHAVLHGAVGLAGENLGLLEQAYEAGKIGLSDLLVEKDRVLRARLQFIDVETELLETQLTLAASAGALGLFGLDEGSLPGDGT
jgi:cobalt-zinc-cadmium efflux system outer membrane protein